MPPVMRIIASVLGIAAVIIGSIHGYYETQQGSTAPLSVFINAIGGTECEPNCLPAMTIIPNFLAAGVTTIVVALAMLGWIALRLNDRTGALGLILLSIVLLLAGGGFLPFILGIIGGAVGLRLRTK